MPVKLFLKPQPDYDAMEERMRATHKLKVLDFTPLLSLGNITLLQRLNSYKEEAIVLVRQGHLCHDIRDHTNLSLIECDDGGFVKNVVYRFHALSTSELISPYISIGHNIKELRKGFVENKLIAKLQKCIRTDPGGKPYVTLPDQSYADKWIDAKRLLDEPEYVLSLAYEMGYFLTNGYNDEISEHGFLAANNNGLVLASYLQLIFPTKKLGITNKFGPLLSPNPLLNIPCYCDALEGCRFCAVTDVVSTGRELDLIAAIMSMRRSVISRAITVYDLQISRPITNINILALCAHESYHNLIHRQREVAHIANQFLSPRH